MRYCPLCLDYFPDDVSVCPKDGGAVKRTHDPYLGRTIAARYRLTKRLGSGGMSTVYLANHVMIERISALKILREDLSKNPTHRERFLREARAVNRINHPNIVEITDVGEADGVAYLVMEFIDGPSLHQALAAGPLPWTRAVRIGMQVASALARAHQMGVIHRDLKPENILLAPCPPELAMTPYPSSLRPGDDFAKLTDFGIAKIIDAPALTFSEQLFGTPGYIAPEYIEGAACDARSDLYSLGVILYEMTTGELPYDARGAALLTKPLLEPPVPPSRRVASYPAELEELELGLLARSPADRPADAFFVHDALAHLLRRAGPSMTPANPVPPVVSSTPDATRISYEPLGQVRPDAATMSGEPQPVSSSAVYSLQTLSARGPGGWHEAIAELEVEIATATRRGTDPARTVMAGELLEVARAHLGAAVRASHVVATRQSRVDALEDDARRFRADIGKAVDELALDLSRERALARAVRSRRQAADTVGAPSSGDERKADVSLWERVALAAAEQNAGATEEDLVFQIESLQASLDAKNTVHDTELTEAVATLEGALAALRHITHEMASTIAEARAELSPGPRAPSLRM